ncbi:MAG: PIN domain-containing protein [Lachnospiraceae bacterium]|nr:PIN domain-containing protein [Lachnospiraceae bacterium]
MVVLIDTNVILDFLVTREPFYRASAEILSRCAAGELAGYIAFHSVPNLWYILRKTPEEKRREWMEDICSFLRVTGAEHEEVVGAIRRKDFPDFEDCLQDKCAKSAGAEYIITRNPSDFMNSEVPAVEPEIFLEMLKRQGI